MRAGDILRRIVHPELDSLDGLVRRPARIAGHLLRGELVQWCETRVAVITRARTRARGCGNSWHTRDTHLRESCRVKEDSVVGRVVGHGLGLLMASRMLIAPGYIATKGNEELVHGRELLWRPNVKGDGARIEVVWLWWDRTGGSMRCCAQRLLISQIAESSSHVWRWVSMRIHQGTLPYTHEDRRRA